MIKNFVAYYNVSTRKYEFDTGRWWRSTKIISAVYQYWHDENGIVQCKQLTPPIANLGLASRIELEHVVIASTSNSRLKAQRDNRSYLVPLMNKYSLFIYIP
jgi:hypothetical protein